MIQSEINKIRCKPGCKILLLLVAWSDGMGWWEEMSRCESLCDSNFEASMEASIGLEEMSEPNIEASIGYIMGYMIGSCWLGCIGAMSWWVPKMNMETNDEWESWWESNLGNWNYMWNMLTCMVVKIVVLQLKHKQNALALEQNLCWLTTMLTCMLITYLDSWHDVQPYLNPSLNST